MTVKELLIQELEDTNEPLVLEVLEYLRYLKFRQTEDADDLREAKAALAEAKKEGTVSWEATKVKLAN